MRVVPLIGQCFLCADLLFRAYKLGWKWSQSLILDQSWGSQGCYTQMATVKGFLKKTTADFSVKFTSDVSYADPEKS